MKVSSIRPEWLLFFVLDFQGELRRGLSALAVRPVCEVRTGIMLTALNDRDLDL